MNAHNQASVESQSLCDMLFNKLSQKIPNLRRDYKQRWCGLYQESRTRFAYVNHRKTKSLIEVWCMGEPDELQQLTKSIEILTREEFAGRWSERFKCRFFIDDHSLIDDAANLLYTISYSLS